MEYFTFVYGRKDVFAQSGRGYNIYKTNRDPQEDDRKAVMAARRYFSIGDPEGYQLQNLGDFWVYFRLPEVQNRWVFGRGKTREQGELDSYLFYGVFLSESDREALLYNPFFLADELDPDLLDNSGRNFGLKARTVENSYPKNILSILDRIPAATKFEKLKTASQFVQKLIRDDKKCFIPYNSALSGELWSLIFMLLPPKKRKETSLNTYSGFFDADRQLPLRITGILVSNWDRWIGELDWPELKPQGYSIFEYEKSDPYPSLKFFSSLKEPIYWFFYRDVLLEIDRNENYSAHESFLRIMDFNFPIQSLDSWPPISPNMIKWKIWHFKEVLNQNLRDLPFLESRLDKFVESCVSLLEEMARNRKWIGEDSRKTIKMALAFCLKNNRVDKFLNEVNGSRAFVPIEKFLKEIGIDLESVMEPRFVECFEREECRIESLEAQLERIKNVETWHRLTEVRKRFFSEEIPTKYHAKAADALASENGAQFERFVFHLSRFFFSLAYSDPYFSEKVLDRFRQFLEFGKEKAKIYPALLKNISLELINRSRENNRFDSFDSEYQSVLLKMARVMEQENRTLFVRSMEKLRKLTWGDKILFKLSLVFADLCERDSDLKENLIEAHMFGPSGVLADAAKYPIIGSICACLDRTEEPWLKQTCKDAVERIVHGH